MTRKLTVTLLAIVAIFFSTAANKAMAATPHEIKDIIVKTAVSMGVDPCVALSIAKQESNFQDLKGRYGTVGVFQLMPSTAQKMGLNAHNMQENIKGGIMYYQMMYKKFGSIDLALAAYNAGPGNVAKYNGIPPFKETRHFVNTIKTNSKLFANDPIVLKYTTKKEEPKKEEEPKKTSATEPVKQAQEEPVALQPDVKQDETIAAIQPENTLQEEQVVSVNSLKKEEEQEEISLHEPEITL